MTLEMDPMAKSVGGGDGDGVGFGARLAEGGGGNVVPADDGEGQAKHAAVLYGRADAVFCAGQDTLAV